jgi:hypothetical protein
VVDREYFPDDSRDCRTLQSLHADPDHRRSGHAGDDKNGMKVGIKRDDDPACRSRMLEDVGIRRSGHPDLAHMRTINADGAELLSRIAGQSLVEQNGRF